MLVNTFKTLVDEGDSRNKIVLERLDDLVEQIAKFKGNVATCKRHAIVVANLYVCDSMGYKLGASIVPLQPYFVASVVASIEKSFLSIKTCVSTD